MHEIWETPSGNAFLKVERANKHIADIEHRLLSSSDRYGPSLHIDSQTGEQFLYYYLTDRTLRPDLALITGDAVHNLRCALDIAWCGAVGKKKYCKFPFYPNKTREGLEATIKATVSPVLVDFVVNKVKCHGGGDADLLALHTLDIDDKHHLLIPVLAVTDIHDVELQYPDGKVETLNVTIENRLDSFRKVVPLDSKLKNRGQVTFQVTFREGTAIEGVELIPMLRKCSAKVLRITRLLQKMALDSIVP